MRLALASLIALSGLAPVAMAQNEAPAAPATPAAATPAPAAPVAPSMTAPMPAPGPSTTGAMPAPGAAPEATPAAPPAPPPPPPAPTDPTAIGAISAVESLCIPLVDGGDINKLTKAAGFRKSGDNWVNRQKTFQLTMIPPGSNPDQCHIDITHPVDPAAPVVVALHNWAAVTRGWTLYRNDKNVDAGQEFTTRSWENDANGKHMALVFTTIRKADGTPMRGNVDTSEILYSATKTGG